MKPVPAGKQTALQIMLATAWIKVSVCSYLGKKSLTTACYFSDVIVST